MNDDCIDDNKPYHESLTTVAGTLRALLDTTLKNHAAAAGKQRVKTTVFCSEGHTIWESTSAAPTQAMKECARLPCEQCGGPPNEDRRFTQRVPPPPMPKTIPVTLLEIERWAIALEAAVADEDTSQYRKQAREYIDDERTDYLLRNCFKYLLGEITHLRERERHFATVLKVADGGQFRSDWDARLKGIVQERDQLRAARYGDGK